MRLKNLPLALAVVCCGNLFAQEKFPLTEIITRTYIGMTNLLNDDVIAIAASYLVVTSMANNQFEVTLETSFDGGVFMGVYNILEQEVGFNKEVPQVNNAYKFHLDTSKMSTGVYLIKMGGQTTTTYETARIIVK